MWDLYNWIEFYMLYLRPNEHGIANDIRNEMSEIPEFCLQWVPYRLKNINECQAFKGRIT